MPAPGRVGARRRRHRRTPAGGGSVSLRIAGIDEAGRGPLAGPVTVAAVVFAPGRTPVNGLDDSKALSAARREVLYPRIIERALAWTIMFVEVDEIDRRNIYHATLHGMREALLGVAHVADAARIDGNRLPADLPCP
ncbi:MAG: ribonuclease HII, partial [Lysobacteraceae bacterium]